MTQPTKRKIFGKELSEYVAFQQVPLGLVAAVGVARLVASLAGLPDGTVTWLSMTAVGWAAVVYYGIAVHRRGLGSYRHLLPLVAIQVVIVQIIAVAGILLSIAGLPNIYAAPEFNGPFAGPSPNPWAHAAAHLTIGIVVPILLSWGVASLILFVTRALARRKAAA